MIVMQSQFLPTLMSQQIESFCNFAFANTTFPNVIVRFETFDPTYVARATTDPQEIGIVVTYNVRPEECIEDILEVLAHEAIHVQQLSDGRLEMVILWENGRAVWGFRWEGVPYFYPKTAREVLNLPWETEAYANSPKILSDYYNFLKKTA